LEHVLLPVLDDDRARVVTKEMLEVDPTPEGFRLLHSPAMVDGLAGGDVIRLDPARREGFELVRRGRNLAVVVAFASLEQRGEAEPQLAAQVKELQGVCDGGPGRGLVFTVPVAAGFARIEAMFEAASARFPGASWYFGNVYGPDRQPLNWW
jgi:hypothetical protein